MVSKLTIYLKVSQPFLCIWKRTNLRHKNRIIWFRFFQTIQTLSTGKYLLNKWIILSWYSKCFHVLIKVPSPTRSQCYIRQGWRRWTCYWQIHDKVPGRYAHRGWCSIHRDIATCTCKNMNNKKLFICCKRVSAGS